MAITTKTLVKTPTHLDRLSVGPYGTPDVPNTVLQLTAEDGAFLLPNLTSAQAQATFNAATGTYPATITNSVVGMEIYITDGGGGNPAPFNQGNGIYVCIQTAAGPPVVLGWAKIATGAGTSLPGPGIIVTDGSGNPSNLSNLTIPAADTAGSLELV